ncbi:hypothetical protein LSCM1_02124 [Leishmania martiniquensis]|uniref:Leucine-rich repeat protein n=1 Tax=Leishmania martiniquensis TaxID=1580590 RepID=A0A836GM91_9TRYP|nr:hypothetical protein LSCM1_02124 [Leishmania martiniquensis]
MKDGLTSPSLRSPFSADQLACIASYWPSAAHRCGFGGVQHQKRLPLAWIAVSPAARVVAEQRHAWVVLPFTHTGACPANAEACGSSSDLTGNVFGAALANATTQPRVLQLALGADGAGASVIGVASASSQQSLQGSASRSVLSWLKRTSESLANIDHRVSRVTSASLATANGGSSSAARGMMDAADAARCCGVHLGGLTVVLVSGVHELDAAGGTALREDKASSGGAEMHESDSSLHGEGEAAALHPGLLFPSTTTCGGSVASMLSVPPKAALYDTITGGAGEEGMPSTGNSIFRSGAELHGDDGGADSDTANDPKTAASVYVVEQLSKLRHHMREAERQQASATGLSSRDLLGTVWYRQVFVSTAEATDEVLCGVSQWWLERAIRRDELPTAVPRFSNVAQRNRSICVSGSGEESQALPPPSLHIKYVTDVFANVWWPHRFNMALKHRLAEQTTHASWMANLLRLIWVVLVVLVETTLRGVPPVAAPFRVSDGQRSGSQNSPSHRRGVRPLDLVSAFHKMGKVYGKHRMEALDVGHTRVRGAHLLACALGSVMAPATTSDGEAAAVHHKGLWALDMAGCTQLHHRHGELCALSHTLKQLLNDAARRVAALSPCGPSWTLAVADLLLSLSLRDGASLPRTSAAGLALALFTHHGHLTWVCGAGSAVDNAALRELGHYALLVESVAATQQPPPSHTSTCALRALDLTSALSIDDVNSVAYLTQLEQLLLPFTNVDDVGIGCLDGQRYARDLGAILASCIASSANEAAELPDGAQKSLQGTLADLQHLIPIKDDSVQGDVHRRKPHTDVVEVLYQAFRSHLYHIDLTYCLRVSSVKGLMHQQRLELLNLSQTRVNKAGLFGGAGPRYLTRSPASTAQPRCTPPLRLFIAEMCEHLSDLSGLAHMTTLECVIVRSGSLGDAGLRPVCTPDMHHLTMMDLSYCDGLHHVGCLAQLPALETLILDSTDVTPAEVAHLRSSRSLHTLSLRFCTEFAFIGKGLKELEAVVGRFAALKRYLYEDLAGDDKLREGGK